jgi:transcriptional regulator with XRE-family HTH domain
VFEFGKRLGRFRRSKGISQTVLAGAMGVSRSTVARLEAGETAHIGILPLLRMAEKLNVSLLYLHGMHPIAERPQFLDEKELRLVKAFREMGENQQDSTLEMIEESQAMMEKARAT